MTGLYGLFQGLQAQVDEWKELYTDRVGLLHVRTWVDVPATLGQKSRSLPQRARGELSRLVLLEHVLVLMLS
jgi:hypothetical protein